jgi:hypothetical protein
VRALRFPDGQRVTLTSDGNAGPDFLLKNSGSVLHPALSAVFADCVVPAEPVPLLNPPTC